MVSQIEHKDFHRHAHYAMRNFDRFRSPSQDYHASVLASPVLRANIAIGPLLIGEHRLWLASFVYRSSWVVEYISRSKHGTRDHIPYYGSKEHSSIHSQRPGSERILENYTFVFEACIPYTN